MQAQAQQPAHPQPTMQALQPAQPRQTTQPPRVAQLAQLAQTPQAVANSNVEHIRQRLFDSKPAAHVQARGSIGRARRCEQQQQWQCVRLAASDALAANPAEPGARDLLEQAVLHLAWPSQPTMKSAPAQVPVPSAAAKP
jgi:hypothetical protein